MTREEAIKELSYIADEMPSMECADWKEAISMAIKALEQEPCEDVVSRTEVLNLVRFNAFHVKSQIKAIENMPSVTPQDPNTWSLDDAREDFMHDVYNTLDFLPTNDEANRIIDIFDRVTSSIEQVPRWIPVTERLPEEGTFVLASYNSDEGTDVIMTYYNKYGFTRGLMTAWMPLPEPYKGGQEDGKA